MKLSDDAYATLRSKLSGPVFFPFLFAAFAFNWRAVFILILKDGPIEERIKLFDEMTNFCSLIVYPALLALGIIFFTPLLRWAVARVTWRANAGKREYDGKADQHVEGERLVWELTAARERVRIANESKAAADTIESIESPQLRAAAKDAITPTSDDETKSDFQPNKTIDGLTWLRNEASLDRPKAIETAQKKGRPLLVVAYDPSVPSDGKIGHSARYFFEYQETRRLVHDNFIVLLTKAEELGEWGQALNISTERPVYIAFNKQLNPVKSGRLNGNPDTGLSEIKGLIEMIKT